MVQPKLKGGLGIHTARKTNIALLGKHVWDLMHNQHKLWVQLLSTKYLKGTHILQAKSVVGVSCIWNSIVKALHCIKPSFKFRVGRGNVSIWYDKWLDQDLLCNLVPYVNIQDTRLHLKDIFSDGDWHFQRLATVIPTEIQLQIRSMFFNDISDDLIIWGHSTSGSYTAKSRYQWLDNFETPTTASNSWSW